MGGFFGTVAKDSCVTDLFYGTDYNSHLGTKRGGMATSTYFRTKFEDELDKFKGNSGIGIISDTDAQPIILNSHLGRFAIVTVAKIANIVELEAELLKQNMHFSELSSGQTNQTELIALLIIQGKNFVEGIENVYRRIQGSCSMLLLTEDGIIAARDKWGRTPPPPASRAVSPTSTTRLTATSVRARLSACMPMASSSSAVPKSGCRSVPSCGYIMASPRPATKAATSRKCVSPVE